MRFNDTAQLEEISSILYILLLFRLLKMNKFLSRLWRHLFFFFPNKFVYRPLSVLLKTIKGRQFLVVLFEAQKPQLRVL